MTRPLIGSAFTTVAGPPADNLYFVWLINWYRESLIHGHLPIHVPTLNAPEGWSIAYSEMSPTMMLLGLPGFLVGGAAFAYNLSFWLSFILSGLFTALWVSRLTGRYAPAILSGLIFAFVPYRLSHAMAGHLNLLGTAWLPLFFLCLTELICGGGGLWALGTAGSIVALAGSSQYYLYMAPLIAVPYAAVLLASRPGWHRDRRLWLSLALAAVVTIPPLLLLLSPYFALARQGLLAPHALALVRMWSASPADFLTLSPVHWLVGDVSVATGDQYFWVERTVTAGFVTYVLAIIGWRATRRTSAVARALALCAGCAFVLALGTDLHWGGQSVRIAGSPIPLPGLLLFWGLPFYGAMRVWMRWGIFVSLFLSVLAGMGVADLTRHHSQRARALTVFALGLLVMLEFSQKPYPLTPIEGRPVDRWLAAQADVGLVIELPVDKLEGPRETFYTMFHEHPFVGAFFSAFPSPQFRRIEPSLRTFPSQDSIATMKALGVRWILVDLKRIRDPGSVQKAAEVADLEPMVELDDELVLRMP